MNWIYNGEQVIDISEFDGFIGYVYIIRNLKTDKAYIGKKLFKFKKTKRIKGKRKRILVESDWKDYYSSCQELKADVVKLGKDNFVRIIIHLCRTKGSMNYLELREQIDRRVLESDEWYNDYIGSRIHRTHVRLT